MQSVRRAARYDPVMPDRSRRRPRDLNSLAATIVDDATTDAAGDVESEGKNPHAVALGRKGGQKGGKARAAKLSAAERSEQARKAAQQRWRQS